MHLLPLALTIVIHFFLACRPPPFALSLLSKILLLVLSWGGANFPQPPLYLKSCTGFRFLTAFGLRCCCLLIRLFTLWVPPTSLLSLLLVPWWGPFALTTICFYKFLALDQSGSVTVLFQCMPQSFGIPCLCAYGWLTVSHPSSRSSRRICSGRLLVMIWCVLELCFLLIIVYIFFYSSILYCSFL